MTKYNIINLHFINLHCHKQYFPILLIISKCLTNRCPYYTHRDMEFQYFQQLILIKLYNYLLSLLKDKDWIAPYQLGTFYSMVTT